MQTWKLNKALFSMTSGSLVLSNQQVTEMELEIPGFCRKAVGTGVNKPSTHDWMSQEKTDKSERK
jgi:hypothetical protein